jgi:radical SAM superfamily enzyme with C-terminal helix-hairpin-helix motif
MHAEALLIDGYVDEPACLGVPPYISPYIRAIAGVLNEHGREPVYVTIDQIRENPAIFAAHRQADCAVLVAGVTVPGRYLGGTPANLTEIQQIGAMLRGTERFLCGPINFGYSPGGGQKSVRLAVAGFEHLLTGSPPEALAAYLSTGKTHGIHDYRHSDFWSISGSDIIRQHPSFPYIICELETARGCSRSASGGCSFCTEPFYGPPQYRTVEAIAGEVSALTRAGACHFRLGRQPDLLVYRSGSGEFPVPRPERVDELFSEIRTAAPWLRTLHIDNINPGTIAKHEDSARAVLEAIVRYHTPGDVAAFGMETADPVVVRENNLKAGPDEVMRALTVVNEVGASRRNGIPELLPGLNFVAGLAGETPETYEKNEQFLTQVLHSGLLVRRVNIRQLMPFEGTRSYRENTLGRHIARFRAFKERTRRTFDHPMLRKVFPAGTILREVVIEEEGQTSFGRQMGSYPILCGIPLRIRKRIVIDVVIVDHGMRSVTVLPCPIPVNELPQGALSWIPGITAKKAGMIMARRPVRDLEEFRSLAGETPLDQLFSFSHLP